MVAPGALRAGLKEVPAPAHRCYNAREGSARLSTNAGDQSLAGNELGRYLQGPTKIANSPGDCFECQS